MQHVSEERICMKCQSLFSGKKIRRKKNISKNDVCLICLESDKEYFYAYNSTSLSYITEA